MRTGLGWPVRPRQQFVGFARWVTEAERAEQQAGPARPSADPEQLAAARAALAEAEQALTGKVMEPGGRRGETVASPLLNGDTVVCSTCGNTAAAGAEITHEEGCPEKPF